MTNAWYTIIYYHWDSICFTQKGLLINSHPGLHLRFNVVLRNPFLPNKSTMLYIYNSFWRTKETKIIQFSLKMLLLEKISGFLFIYVKSSMNFKSGLSLVNNVYIYFTLEWNCRKGNPHHDLFLSNQVRIRYLSTCIINLYNSGQFPVCMSYNVSSVNLQ